MGLPLADKDLVVVKTPKVDISSVTALTQTELAAKLKEVKMASVPNDWLMVLTEQYPAKIEELTLIATQEALDKAQRLKVKYGLVLKEIEARKAAADKVA